MSSDCVRKLCLDFALGFLIVCPNVLAGPLQENFSTTLQLNLEQPANWGNLRSAGLSALPSSLDARDVFAGSDRADFFANIFDSGERFSDEVADTGQAPFQTLSLKNQNMTLSGSGNMVLNLQDFVLAGGILTLQGTAETKFTFNVLDAFSLVHSAKIVLSGGLLATNVVFNVIGRGNAVSLRQQSTLTGMIMAPKRQVSLRGDSTVIGQVTAKRINLSGGSIITPPPIVSP
jgi:hypothetical protein